MVTTANIPLLLAAAGALLALLAAALILRGKFGRRRGESPFCRKCRYNLTGIASDRSAHSDARTAVVPARASTATEVPSEPSTTPSRCPECGTVLAEARSIIYGERPRRPFTLVSGYLTLLLALLCVGGFAWLKMSKVN